MGLRVKKTGSTYGVFTNGVELFSGITSKDAANRILQNQRRREKELKV